MITGESKKKFPKKTLDDLLSSKDVIRGKEVVQRIKEQEKLRKEYEESVEFELRNRSTRQNNR